MQMVIVATPPSARNELIATPAKAGKHILLEKPVARSMSEATKVVEICERAGGHTWRTFSTSNARSVIVS